MTTILIIDDEEQLTQLLSEYLSDFGYITMTAGSAEEGIEILKSNIIEIVIVDIRLPGMTGIEFINKIKTQYNVEYVLYTGVAYDPYFEKLGHVIYKPVELNIILRTINNIEAELKKNKI